MLPAGQVNILQKERENKGKTATQTFFLGKYILSLSLPKDTTSFLDFRMTENESNVANGENKHLPESYTG